VSRETGGPGKAPGRLDCDIVDRFLLSRHNKGPKILPAADHYARTLETLYRRIIVIGLNTTCAIRCIVPVITGFVLASCATVVLAPGADQIKVTKLSTDVASCVVVGNVDGATGSGLAIDSVRQMQNQTVGVGGNTVLVTSALPPEKGVAYRCGVAEGQSH
jgi:hypothetical protein